MDKLVFKSIIEMLNKRLLSDKVSLSEKNLGELDFIQCQDLNKELDKYFQVKSIDMSGNDLWLSKTDELEELAKALVFSDLEEIDLSDNDIGSFKKEDLSALFKDSEQCFNLQKLSLSNNNIGELDVEKLENLANLLAFRYPCLKCFDLSYNNLKNFTENHWVVLCKAFKNLNNLQFILNGNDISLDGIKMLLTAPFVGDLNLDEEMRSSAIEVANEIIEDFKPEESNSEEIGSFLSFAKRILSFETDERIKEYMLKLFDSNYRNLSLAEKDYMNVKIEKYLVLKDIENTEKVYNNKSGNGFTVSYNQATKESDENEQQHSDGLSTKRLRRYSYYQLCDDSSDSDDESKSNVHKNVPSCSIV